MKHAVLTVLAAAAIAAPLAAAQPAHEPKGKAPVTAADVSSQMAQMQDNIGRMERLLDEVHRAKDPKERHALLDQHYEAMQESMQMMRGMGGDPMADLDSTERRELLRRRIDMMQLMMEQIMRHQRLTQIEPEK